MSGRYYCRVEGGSQYINFKGRPHNPYILAKGKVIATPYTGKQKIFIYECELAIVIWRTYVSWASLRTTNVPMYPSELPGNYRVTTRRRLQKVYESVQGWALRGGTESSFRPKLWRPFPVLASSKIETLSTVGAK